MSSPSRPRIQHQLPTCKCTIAGKCLGGSSCNTYSFGMGADKSTLGKKRPSGCDVRRAISPRDVTGGTTQSQGAQATRALTGLTLEVRNGSNVCTPDYAAGQLRRGRGFVLAGCTGALIGTPFRSTKGHVNHGVWVNEGREWYQTSSGVWRPRAGLVYDPLADGEMSGSMGARRPEGPDWWPWDLILKFAAWLHPWGDGDSRLLGPGKFYATLFPDTEPHVHLRYSGSVKTSPLPKKMVIRSPTAGRRVNVRTGPSTSYGVVKTLATGAAFNAYQQNPNGQLLAGSRLWYGSHDGKQWVHSSGIRAA